MLALTGQGRLDQLPAGDLAYLKLVGRLRVADPRARATEEEVEDSSRPMRPWTGLAGLHALRGRRQRRRAAAGRLTAAPDLTALRPLAGQQLVGRGPGHGGRVGDQVVASIHWP